MDHHGIHEETKMNSFLVENRHDCKLLVLAAILLALIFTGSSSIPVTAGSDGKAASPRVRLPINDAWRFTKGDPPNNTARLSYDVVKGWVLPTGNGFLKDPEKRAKRPEGSPGDDVAYAAAGFEDTSWRKLDLPHDYAIEGPFTTAVSGSTGRLPSSGVVWYRRSLSIPASDQGKSLFLDIDGAMSYAMVWLNGQFIGGWPYGYASFRLNLTPYVKPGSQNVLAIRLENPVPANSDWRSASSRWYPGAGLYRNVWLVKTAPVHVGQWGTYITTPEVSKASARIDLRITVDNDSPEDAAVSVATRIYEIDEEDRKLGSAAASIPPVSLQIPAGANSTVETKGTIPNPKLWGTGLHQKPNRYLAVTTVRQEGKIIDVYETPFGVRTLKFDPDAGFF